MNNLLSKWGQLSTKKSLPLQASIELTNRCNERCTHCYIDDFSDDPQKILTEQQWHTVLKELRIGGVLYLILMGGEAMLSPYFWSVLKKASDLGFHVSMITNGLKIKDVSIAKKLKDNGLSVATFSVYSLSDEIHDSMTRVKGSLAKTLNAIDMCLEVGIEPTVNCLLTKNNIKGVFNLYKWAEVKNLQLQVDYNVTPKLSGNLEPTLQRASYDDIRWYFKEMTKRFPNSAPLPSGEKKTDYICNAAKGKCAVTAYGDLLPCIEIRKPLGNLLVDGFMTSWTSEEALKWRGLRVGQIKNQQNLDLQNFCEHCPGLADHEHSDHLKLTEFTEKIGEIKQQLWKQGLDHSS